MRTFIRLDIQLYRTEDGEYCMFIDDMDGSGIEVTGATPEECSDNAAPYLDDYLDRLAIPY